MNVADTHVGSVDRVRVMSRSTQSRSVSTSCGVSSPIDHYASGLAVVRTHEHAAVQKAPDPSHVHTHTR